MARPERFELPTFWFVAEQRQNLSACSGVAYEARTRLLTRTMRPTWDLCPPLNCQAQRVPLALSGWGFLFLKVLLY